MMRDFSIVSTAMGASLSEIKKTGWVGILSLFIGIAVAFFVGGILHRSERPLFGPRTCLEGNGIFLFL